MFTRSYFHKYGNLLHHFFFGWVLGLSVQTRTTSSDFINRLSAKKVHSVLGSWAICWISDRFVPGQWHAGPDRVLHNQQCNNLGSPKSLRTSWLRFCGALSDKQVVLFQLWRKRKSTWAHFQGDQTKRPSSQWSDTGTISSLAVSFLMIVIAVWSGAASSIKGKIVPHQGPSTPASPCSLLYIL